jgi:hypothetical protein
MERAPAMNVATESTAQTGIRKRVSELLIGWALLVALGGTLWLAYKGYGWLDSVGAISHDRTIEVRLKGDWMAAETRTCYPWYFGDTVDGLNCVGITTPDNASWRDGTSHNLSVKFWGKMVRADALEAPRDPAHKGQWNCKRGSDALTCWALN